VRFVVEQRFSAPLPDVEAALLDPAFLDRLGTLPALGRPELLQREEMAPLVRLEVRYAFTGRLSPAVTAVVDPDRLTWVDAAVHDRSTHRTEHRIVPDHYRDRLACSFLTELRPDGDGGGTKRVAEGDLSVRFPLVGGRVERAIVSGMEDHARHEQAALEEWLAEGADKG
jgi:uncharacterized protein DUF2505